MAPINTLFALSVLIMTNTAVALGPAAVNLRSAGNFAILAKSGISTVPSSAITGDIGLSPAAGTALTGFAAVLAPGGTFETSTQVTGKLLAASFTSPTPSILTTAISDMQTAFTDANGRVNPILNLNGGEIGGLTLAPGLYKWTSGVTASSGVAIHGSAADTWIFQISSTFSIASAQRITLSGGALAQNIVWVVTGAVAFGATSHFEGILLGATSVTMLTSSTANGRLLSQTLVALQKATLVAPVTPAICILGICL